MSFLFKEKYRYTWKVDDLEKRKTLLDPLLRPVEQHASNNEINRINYDSVDSNSLDTMRANAREEFVRNGIEVKLNAVDAFRFRMRHGDQSLTLPDSPPLNPPKSTSPPKKMCDTSSVDDYLEMRSQRVTERRKRQAKTSWCVFCKNNGEQVEWYSSHTLKDSMGNTSCPILRRYVCPRCGETGDTAHTIRYCPQREGDTEPAICQLLKTERMASGRLRVSKF